MNLLTHLHLSLRLKQDIEKNLNIKLRTFSFMLGNIKPDLAAPYTHIPHYKKEAEQFVCDEISAILDTKFYETEKSSWQFSERLGIITHYLSDFFCYAHAESFQDSFFKHYFYEMKLALCYLFNAKRIASLEERTFLKGKIPVTLYPGFNSNSNTAYNPNLSSIYNSIDDLHTRYCAMSGAISGKDQPLTDLAFALDACTSVSVSILSLSMADNRERDFDLQRQEVLA